MSPEPSRPLLFPSEAKAILAETQHDKGVPDDASAVHLNEGDRLDIRNVMEMIEDRRFDHLHDRETRLVFLRVTRVNGDVVDVAEPYTFYGVTQLRKAPLRDFYDRLSARIHLDDPSPNLPDQDWDAATQNLWDRPFDQIARLMEKRSREAWGPLLERLPPDGARSADGLSRTRLRRALSAAAAAGYFIAKSEARQAEATAAGAFKNLESAWRARTRQDWRTAADSLWDLHPTWTTNAVAKKIAAMEGETADVRSIARAVKDRAPATSPSRKATT